MPLEIITCPVCAQKLAIQGYVLPGTAVVCANADCLSNLRITQREPLKVEVIPIEATYNPDDRPESYQ